MGLEGFKPLSDKKLFKDPPAIPAEQLEAVLIAITEGESVKRACEGVGIRYWTFNHLVTVTPELEILYLQAQRASAEAMAQDIKDIADNEPDAARARNRMMARQWYSSKLLPNKYGERLDINLTQVVDVGGAIEAGRQRVIDAAFKVINDNQANGSDLGVRSLSQDILAGISDRVTSAIDSVRSGNQSEADPVDYVSESDNQSDNQSEADPTEGMHPPSEDDDIFT